MNIGRQRAERAGGETAPSPAGDKVLPGPASFDGVSAGVFVKWRKAVEHLLPVGYEDAAGFHYGTEKAAPALSHAPIGLNRAARRML